MHKFLPLILVGSLLSGCAGTANNGRSTIQKDIAACMAATKQPQLLVIEVPASDNAISNKLTVATLRMAGSLAVDALVQALTRPTRQPIVVVGESDEVTAASLEMALEKLPANVQRSNAVVCFAGDQQFGPALQSAAETAHVNLVLASGRF